MERLSVHRPRSVCTKAAVGNSAPQLLDQEIVDAHILEIPLGPPFAPRVLEIPDQLLFFVSTEMTSPSMIYRVRKQLVEDAGNSRKRPGSGYSALRGIA